VRRTNGNGTPGLITGWCKLANGDLEFADRRWSVANRLRGTLEAAESRHIVLC